jgi:hypothetical protein
MTTELILDVLKKRDFWTSRSLSEELQEKCNADISRGDLSGRLYRLWKRNLILRSVAPIGGMKNRGECVYSCNDSRNQKVDAEFYGKIYEVQIAGYSGKSLPTLSHSSTRFIIKQIFSAQEKPEPLFPYEISESMYQNYQCQPHHLTLSSTLNRMVYRYGELFRSKTRFEGGHLYHPNSQTVEEWIQNPPYKGLSPDEKCMLQLIKEKTVITTSDIRREATKAKSVLPTACATLVFKIEKLKTLVPWVRTEQYAYVTIIYDANSNPEILEEKLKQVKFWLSEEGKRRRAYGYEFESFCTYIFYDIVHESGKEWFSTDIEVEKNKKGRFGEYDLIIAHTFGPPEFGLKEMLVFEFKTAGRVQWGDLFGYNPKWHRWGFVTKLEKEKEEGIFRGKFVRPILVLAHSIESGLPFEILKHGVVTIYMSQLLEYLERKEIDPDRILKAINSKYYRP